MEYERRKKGVRGEMSVIEMLPQLKRGLFEYMLIVDHISQGVFFQLGTTKNINLHLHWGRGD